MSSFPPSILILSVKHQVLWGPLFCDLTAIPGTVLSLVSPALPSSLPTASLSPLLPSPVLYSATMGFLKCKYGPTLFKTLR